MGKKKFKPIPGGYVALPWKMLNHKAYIELPPAAKGMLPYFLGKVKISAMDPQYYYAEFSLSYTEAAHHGCARRTFSRVIADLIAFGFLDPVHRGYKALNVYRLSNRWDKYGTASFEKISWDQFRFEQIQNEVQKWRASGARIEPVKGKLKKVGCQK